MKFDGINNKALLQKTRELAQNEREVTVAVLHHLREIERRSLFAEIGYPSLFEYAVHELKYSEGAAQRRISAMRLLKSLPEIEKKIEKGELSLCALSRAQSFFKQEKIELSAEKKNLLNGLQGKSIREIEKKLMAASSVPERQIKEKIKPYSVTHTELKILVETKVIEEIEELKSRLAHSLPDAQIKDIIAYAVSVAVKLARPKAPKKPSSDAIPPTLAVKKPNGRYIPKELKRKIWERDKGRCTFECDGKRCLSKHGLEIDHVEPFAMGGSATLENLRLMCRAHNQIEAIKFFGKEKMSQYIRRI